MSTFTIAGCLPEQESAVPRAAAAGGQGALRGGDVRQAGRHGEYPQPQVLDKQQIIMYPFIQINKIKINYPPLKPIVLNYYS